MQQPDVRTTVLACLVRKGVCVCVCVLGGGVLAKKTLVVGHTVGVPPRKELMGTAPTLGSSVIAWMEDLALDLLCDSD